jgi:hypothetical protein
MGIHKKPEYV